MTLPVAVPVAAVALLTALALAGLRSVVAAGWRRSRRRAAGSAAAALAAALLAWWVAVAALTDPPAEARGAAAVRVPVTGGGAVDVAAYVDADGRVAVVDLTARFGRAVPPGTPVRVTVYPDRPRRGLLFDRRDALVGLGPTPPGAP